MAVIGESSGILDISEQQEPSPAGHAASSKDCTCSRHSVVCKTGMKPDSQWCCYFRPEEHFAPCRFAQTASSSI